MADILNKITSNIEDPTQQTTVTVVKKDTPLNYFNSDKLYAMLRAEMKEELKTRKPRQYVRASEAGDCCNLLYLRLTNATVNFEMATKNHHLLLMAHVGNSIHDFIQKKYTFSATELPRNSDKYKIHCRVDGVLDNDVILEIKTVSDCNVLREKDVFQVAANFLVLEDHGFHIRGGQLLYVERTLTRMQTFEFGEEELREYAKKLIAKINHLFDCIAKQQEPNAYLDLRQCVYCEYNKCCSRKGGKR